MTNGSSTLVLILRISSYMSRLSWGLDLVQFHASVAASAPSLTILRAHQDSPHALYRTYSVMAACQTHSLEEECSNPLRATVWGVEGTGKERTKTWCMLGSRVRSDKELESQHKGRQITLLGMDYGRIVTASSHGGTRHHCTTESLPASPSSISLHSTHRTAQLIQKSHQTYR